MDTEEQAMKKQGLLWLVRNQKELKDPQLQLLLHLLEGRDNLTDEEREQFLRHLQRQKPMLLLRLAGGKNLADLEWQILLRLLQIKNGLTDEEQELYLHSLAKKPILTDAELQELLIADLNGCFWRLLEMYQGTLYRYANRLTQNPHDAEQVVQDVMLNVYATWSGFTAERMRGLNLRAYLLRSIHNEFVEARRYDEVHNPWGMPLEIDVEEGSSILAMLEDPHPQPEVVVEEAEMLNLLRKLPKGLSQGLVLFSMGLSYQEIAEVLGLPLHLVRSRIHRARLVLKEMIKQHNSEKMQKPKGPGTRRPKKVPPTIRFFDDLSNQEIVDELDQSWE